MVESATTAAGSGLTVGKGPDRRDTHETMRTLAARDFSAAKGYAPWPSQLDRLERMGRWIRVALAREGDAVIRSWQQLFRAVGLPDAGGLRANRASYRSSWARTLDDLEAMGWIEGWQPVLKANGEGRGILLRLRRDSSVGRARHQNSPSRGRNRPAGGCSSFSRELVPPLREKSPSSRSEGLKEVEKRQARATRAREGRRAGHRATAKAIRQLAEAGEGSGAELVAALPELKSLHPAVLLRAATYTYAPRPSAGWAKHWTPRLSLRSRLAAESACDQLDRYDGRGAGAAAILDLAAGGWRLHTPGGRGPRFVEPRTPGVLVKGLRQRARLARRAARMRDELYAASEGWT
jgi:hypothetical protein